MTLAPSTQHESLPPWAEWLLGWPGIVLTFLWGFAESTLFFILPDVPLSLAALYRARRSLVHVAAIVLGAVLGGGIMFAWAAHSSAARSAVAHVPLVRPAMFERAESDYAHFGVWASALGPRRGIPYKIYAVEAPEHCSLTAFLLVTIPARLWRLLAVWLIFAAVGIILRRLGRGSAAPLLHAMCWIIVYAIYWINVG